MKIRFIKQQKSEWGHVWASHIKVFIVSLGKFAIQVSFGKKPFDAIEYRKFLDEQFNKFCKVCHKPLLVQNLGQIVNYHQECRKSRHNK